MSTPVKISLSGTNVEASLAKTLVNRNVSSGVLKLSAKFEHANNNTDQTTIPKPPLPKAVIGPKNSSNFVKPSAWTPPSATINISKTGSGADSSIGSSGLPKPPPTALKPVPMSTAQQAESIPEHSEKPKVGKPNFSSRNSFLKNSSATLLKNSNMAEDSKTTNKPVPKFPSNIKAPMTPSAKPLPFKAKSDTVQSEIQPKVEQSKDNAPKVKPLPNFFTLGKCPDKPKRPPNINLDKFLSISKSDPGNDALRSKTLAPDGVDENYDDVGVISPLPHSGDTIENTNEDDELYIDLETNWEENDSKDTSKQDKKKSNKDKKHLEMKKDKKELEKKEREARKIFKLSGPVTVLLSVKVQRNCKGGKDELSLSEGETIEIVRLANNPEGLWLARNTEGNYGYVKASALDVPRTDVYDDVEVVASPDSSSSIFPPPPPSTTSDADEIYEDLDSQSPHPPRVPLPDLPSEKAEGPDLKTKKKWEKEEKEFRKKFKYDGEIAVLYQVVVIAALNTKKWGSKDLNLRPGELIDVIVKPQDGKLIGRNKEGKFGYVCVLNIQGENDVYDDVGEDCIYDN